MASATEASSHNQGAGAVHTINFAVTGPFSSIFHQLNTLRPMHPNQHSFAKFVVCGTNWLYCVHVVDN